ncbi:GNAT family N-acetyltransferase [Siccirubricoccus phaeus]|uniref:GNAT family N-acetyltransferase n=1 Tax=Siccirubricoccus phaeus TaxID=2595053 RepID=UPI001F443FCE|nr:GNAT family N-acetyltransferase [Siccirubricoccus phaeus]
MILRPGRDADAEGFIALIGACWAEYPGCVLDVDGEVPELRALASYFAEAGGALWAAEEAGEVIGMVGTRPLGDDAAWEICRMYVAARHRGTGLAHLLLDLAEAHARAAGARRLVLWSDTRFDAAHCFYEKRCYVRQGAIRILDDLSKSLEFRYAKPATGLVVEMLDAAAAGSAERRLAAIQARCGAEAAPAFWRRVTGEVATGQRLLLVAWLEGRLVGTVQVETAAPPHRGRISLLLVDPAERRRGVGRALLQAVERCGRRLLTLECPAGSAAEALIRGLGWQEAGRIPGYGPDREDVVFFYKALG